MQYISLLVNAITFLPGLFLNPAVKVPRRLQVKLVEEVLDGLPFTLVQIRSGGPQRAV